MDTYFGNMDYFLKSLKKSLTPLIEIQMANQVPFENFTNAFKNNVNLQKLIEIETANYSMDGLYEGLRTFSDQLRTISSKLVVPDMDSYRETLNQLKSVIQNEEYMDSIYELAKSSIEEEYEDIDKEEIKEIVEEEINKPIGFQEKVEESVEHFKKKNYIVALVIYIIWNVFISPYLQQHIGVPVMTNIVSNVREFPSKASNVIGKLETEVKAIIVGNENYYYKVKYTDNSGVEQEGYVAKRNLKLLEDEDTVSGNEAK